MQKIYSNAIVFRGHPDKVCDQISDALLDAYLDGDANSRCGIEVAGGKGIIFITGEVTSNTRVDVKKVVRRVLRSVGYQDDLEIIVNLGQQSRDIAAGTNNEAGGAGDNGMMFGFACNNTKEMLPTAMVILQKLSKKYDALTRESDKFKPDGKAQITGYYNDRNELEKIKTFTICYQNTEQDRENTDETLRGIARQICSEYGIDIEEFLVNPTGKFEIGGFDGDAGLTGRKIVVDSYQSFANVGGGAFSGKDPTKVDRSGAYKAREIAKEYLLKHNLAWCEVQLSYAIGMKKPLAIYINSDQGALEPHETLYDDCEVSRIILDLNLRGVKYEDKARFGHF